MINIGDIEQAVISYQSYLKDLNHALKTGETWKAAARREATGWFQKYAPVDKSGIDIGCQYDPLNHTFRRYDIIFGDSDAQQMADIASETFYTVYSSHCLEHMRNPVEALQNWWRILKPGGHLIFLVPHRDLYEMKTILPSQWNVDHKWYFLPDRSEEPCTLNVAALVTRAIPDAEVIGITTLNEGYDSSGGHPQGEYSIEVILHKPYWKPSLAELEEAWGSNDGKIWPEDKYTNKNVVIFDQPQETISCTGSTT